MTSIAIYAKAQDAVSMDQQVQACREFAQAEGFTVATVFTEDPTGRGKDKIKRPEFQELLAGLRAKKFDGVIAYDLARLTRDPRDLENLIDALQEAGANARIVSGDFEIDSAFDFTMARTMVALASKTTADHSRRTSRGIQRAKEARA